MPAVVSYQTYKTFAKKYKIKLSVGGLKKTIKTLAREIKQFELTKNVKDGLYY
jgi:hypothetical protein